MMRALRLDYAAGGRYLNVLGILFLLLVVSLTAYLGWHFNVLREEKNHLETRLSSVEAKLHASMSMGGSVQIEPAKLAEIIKFSNRVIHQLNLPWETLFTQLEEAKGENVALLAVEPDSKSSIVHVTGEAKDYAAMLDYVRTLSYQGALQGVYLVDHKMDEQNQDNPIRFTLEASWAAK